MGLNFTSKQINSFKEADLTGISLPSIVIYKNPKDYPEECVARIWSLDKPTNIIMLRNTVEELMAEAREEYPDAYFIPPCDADDEKIVGTYIL